MTRAIAPLFMALVAASLGGCGSSPTSTYYRLKPDAALSSMGTAMPQYVVVNPVTIPELVDRPQIVVSVAGNQVWPNEFERWAGPLKSNIQRTLAGNLSILLGSENVSTFGADSSDLPTWRVRVDVMQFDSVPGNMATIEALWTIWPPGKATPIVGRTLAHVPAQGQGYDALVAAHDHALGMVSQDVAAAILKNLPR